MDVAQGAERVQGRVTGSGGTRRCSEATGVDRRVGQANNGNVQPRVTAFRRLGCGTGFGTAADGSREAEAIPLELSVRVLVVIGFVVKQCGEDG